MYKRQVHARNDLDTGRQFVLDGQRRLRHLTQNYVNTEANTVKLFVRLEMNVGGAFVNRIQQDFLQKLDDWGVFDFAASSIFCD